MLGLFLGWLTLRSGSIWPAVIGHTVNNVVGLSLVPLLLKGQPNPLLGPTAASLLGGIGLTLFGLWLFYR